MNKRKGVEMYKEMTHARGNYVHVHMFMKEEIGLKSHAPFVTS